MAKKNLVPVSIWGIEFDALIDETRNMSATVPSYTVESGYSVSDSIINDPLEISMTLFITNNPVTWLGKHGSSLERVEEVCQQLEQAWEDKKTTKIVTTDCIYTNMAITSIAISKSSENGYARQVSITAHKVVKTSRKTAKIPKGLKKSGTTKSSSGTASTSSTSSTSESTGTASTSTSYTASDGSTLTGVGVTSSSSSSASSSSILMSMCGTTLGLDTSSNAGTTSEEHTVNSRVYGYSNKKTKSSY